MLDSLDAVRLHRALKSNGNLYKQEMVGKINYQSLLEGDQIKRCFRKLTLIAMLYSFVGEEKKGQKAAMCYYNNPGVGWRGI